MTVKEMNDKELLLAHVNSKKQADYYYRQVKEIEEEMKARYDKTIEEGRRENG